MYRYALEESMQTKTFVVAIVFSILPTQAVILRFSASRMTRRAFGWSELLLILSLVFALAYQAMIIVSLILCGLGLHMKHQIELGGMDAEVLLLKILLVVEILWPISLGLAKGSILFLYSQLFSVRKFVRLAQMAGCLVVVWVIVAVAGAFFICTPLESNWDLHMGGNCGNVKALWFATGIFHVATDVLILLLPMPYLYNLDLKTYKKWTLMVTFGIGLAVCIVSIVRLVLVIRLNEMDAAYDSATVFMMSALEPSLLIIAACLPLLRPFLTLCGCRPPVSSQKNSAARSAFKYHRNPATDSSGGNRGYRNSNAHALRSQGFGTLQDDSSEKELNTRPDSSFKATAKSKRASISIDRSSQGPMSPDRDIELGAIAVRRDWIVEERDRTDQDHEKQGAVISTSSVFSNK